MNRKLSRKSVVLTAMVTIVATRALADGTGTGGDTDSRHYGDLTPPKRSFSHTIAAGAVSAGAGGTNVNSGVGMYRVNGITPLKGHGSFFTVEGTVAAGAGNIARPDGSSNTVPVFIADGRATYAANLATLTRNCNLFIGAGLRARVRKDLSGSKEGNDHFNEYHLANALEPMGLRCSDLGDLDMIVTPFLENVAAKSYLGKTDFNMGIGGRVALRSRRSYASIESSHNLGEVVDGGKETRLGIMFDHRLGSGPVDLGIDISTRFITGRVQPSDAPYPEKTVTPTEFKAVAGVTF